MKIAFIAAGAGDTYCGACNHDVTLIRGLIARGHDVTVIPLYTPLKIEPGEALPQSRIFYGGINVYLQQALGLFRRTPAFVDRWLDRPALLRLASRFAVKTRPESLGPMTVSVLEGARGRQRKEVTKLVGHIETLMPDVVHLTNTMLSGIVPVLKARRRAPAIVATCQGEDAFVESIPSPWSERARDLMQNHGRMLERIVAPCRAAADRMASFLDVAPEAVSIVPPGIDVNAYINNRETQTADGPIIGYLSRIGPEKGLDVLIEAARIVRDRGVEFCVDVGGRVVDNRFFKDVRTRIAQLGLTDRVRFHGEIPAHEKPEYLSRCSIFCVPYRDFETDGMAVLEAQAAGVPAVAPRDGIFPEMFELTGGGVTVPGRRPEDWAEALGGCLQQGDDRTRRRDAIRRAVAEHYSTDRMVDGMISIYEGSRHTASSASKTP